MMFVTHSVYESVYLSQRIVVMAARPGAGDRRSEVDAPYPRDEKVRASSPAYSAYCPPGLDLLDEAMGVPH